MVKLLPGQVKTESDFWPAEGKVLENFGDRPIRFRTRKELREHCKRTGLSSGALL